MSSGVSKKVTIECGVAASIHAAKRICQSDRFVERYDEAHSTNQEDHIIATDMLGPVCISVVYVERGTRKRIFSAFEAADDDITDYMVTYAIIE